MKTQFFAVVVLIVLCGCAHRDPTWSKASPAARASGEFVMDDAYFDSQQFTNDIQEDVEVVLRLKKQLGHDEGETARTKLNASLSNLQKATASNVVQTQQAWLAQTYVASPNITGKITTITDPINAKGQVMVQQIITYYDNDKMRYATNRFVK